MAVVQVDRLRVFVALPVCLLSFCEVRQGAPSLPHEAVGQPLLLAEHASWASLAGRFGGQPGNISCSVTWACHEMGLKLEGELGCRVRVGYRDPEQRGMAELLLQTIMFLLIA
jgi:hypothetical protein